MKRYRAICSATTNNTISAKLISQCQELVDVASQLEDYFQSTPYPDMSFDDMLQLKDNLNTAIDLLSRYL